MNSQFQGVWFSHLPRGIAIGTWMFQSHGFRKGSASVYGELLSWSTGEQWKKGPCLFRVYREWTTTQLDRDCFINHYTFIYKDPYSSTGTIIYTFIRIPINQPGWLMESKGPRDFFGRAQVVRSFFLLWGGARWTSSPVINDDGVHEEALRVGRVI